MKLCEIELMHQTSLCMITAEETKKLLKSEGIKSIKRIKDEYFVLVQIKDLPEIRRVIGDLLLINSEGYEMNGTDIQKVMKDENIPCEE